MINTTDPLDLFFKKHASKVPPAPADEKAKILKAILSELDAKIAPKKSFFSFFLNPALIGTFSLMIIGGLVLLQNRVAPPSPMTDQEKDEIASFFDASLTALDENTEFALNESDDF